LPSRILDPIGGKGFGRNFDMPAPLGMVVSYGRLDGPPDADLLTAMRANSPKVAHAMCGYDEQPNSASPGRTR
jgi:hypothetical protein